MNPVPMMEADETASSSGVHFAKNEQEHDEHDVQEDASQSPSIEETSNGPVPETLWERFQISVKSLDGKILTVNV